MKEETPKYVKNCQKNLKRSLSVLIGGEKDKKIEVTAVQKINDFDLKIA